MVSSVRVAFLALALAGTVSASSWEETLEERLNAEYAAAGHVLEKEYVARMDSLPKAQRHSVQEPKVLSVAQSTRYFSSPPTMAPVATVPPHFDVPITRPVCRIGHGMPVPPCYTESQYMSDLLDRAYELVLQGLLVPSEVMAWTEVAVRLTEKHNHHRCPSQVALNNIERMEANLKLTSLGQPNCFMSGSLQSYVGSENLAFSFENRGSSPVDLYRYTYAGFPIFMQTVQANTVVSIQCHKGTAWKVTYHNYGNSCIDAFRTTVTGQEFSVSSFVMAKDQAVGSKMPHDGMIYSY